MFLFQEYKLKNYKFPLIFCVIAMAVLGLMILESAVANDAGGPDMLRKQKMGLIAGGVVMMILSLVDYHFITRLFPLVYLAMAVILILVFTPLGVSAKGATRWLVIPGLGQLQPSEFAKIFMILFFAAFFERIQEKINKAWMVLLTLALFAVPALLIFKEPDLSTTIVFTFIFITLYYEAGISYKWILGAVGLSVPAAGFLVWDCLQENSIFFEGYMKNRILSFLHPEDFASTGLVDQQSRAVLAISSGQFSGKGLNTSSFESVKSGNFLSEENCDFIFAVIGEELGFIGSIMVITLLAAAVFMCYRTAAQAKDLSGKLIAVGVGTMIGFQTFVNIGVTSGMLPNTGIPLPFFSAGLSSLFSVFLGLGLVMNVALQRRE